MKYWLWHRCLSHLNFGTINQLAKQGLVKGMPKLKYTKDHLCSACQMGNNKKESHPQNPEPSTYEKLQMLRMDLCGPIRTKDEALEIIIKFLKQAQISLNATQKKSQRIIKMLWKNLAGSNPCKRRSMNFKRLKVWELIPRPDRAMIIYLKWIFKVKLDEYGGVLKNKALGIFINQSKYALEMLKKYSLEKSDAVDDPNGTPVDPTRYRGMVGSLMYLTASLSDLVFAACMCARYQTKPIKKHLITVKRVFWYLKGTINMGLWYSKDTAFNLKAFVDADYVGCQDSRKSTSGSAQFLGEKLVRSDSKLHSSQDDQPITKLLNTTNDDYKFGMEVPAAMISDAIKKKVGYTYYMAKKVESEKAKIIDEPEEQHVSPVKSRKGKGFIGYINQVVNAPNKLKKYFMPRITRSLTIVEETVVGQKLKDPTVNDLTIQSLLDLRKRLKASRLESLRQKKQAAAREGSSVIHKKYYDSSDSDVTLYSSNSEESAKEIDDANEFDMYLSNDNPEEDDHDARYGVFMHNKSTAIPNSTYLSPTVTSSSLVFIHTLLNETLANELIDFMSHPVYTYAQTTSVMNNPEGTPELTSYISCSSKVPLGTHVGVLVTKTLMQEMFSDENAHHIPSLPAKKIPYPTTNRQPNSL
uniref:GAG-pre-integrase domain-containing protein n=1 Tax=Tanacetum cinerariifolium TaxID=118510 RepID=A0A6L2P6F3_TANCI|nr:hypothetical protein [Tanacetum cinerariifolium]